MIPRGYKAWLFGALAAQILVALCVMNVFSAKYPMVFADRNFIALLLSLAVMFLLSIYEFVKLDRARRNHRRAKTRYDYVKEYRASRRAQK